MIAAVVSAQNRCYYCITAHGAAVRSLSDDPALGELMVMNYRAARLDKRRRAMLDFAVKLTAEPWLIEEADRERLRSRLLRPRHLGHRRGRRLLQHDQPARLGHRHAAEQPVSRAGEVSRAVVSKTHVGGRFLPSSPRRRGPILRVPSMWHDLRKLESAVVMGPRLRGDDSEEHRH